MAESGVGLGALRAAAGALFWLEVRPLDGGRTTLVRGSLDGDVRDVTPAGVNVRTLVHEYGGGAYTLHEQPDGGVTVFYSEFADQRLYRLEVGDGAAGGMGEDESTAWKLCHASHKFDSNLAAAFVIAVAHDGDNVPGIKCVHHVEHAAKIARRIDDPDAVGVLVEAELLRAQNMRIRAHQQVDCFVPAFQGDHGALPVAHMRGQ